MYYLYLLHSKTTDDFYVGTASDLKKRFYSHNAKRNIATKPGVPWKLVYYEAYPTKEDTERREKRLKQYGQALCQLKNQISLVDRP